MRHNMIDHLCRRITPLLHALDAPWMAPQKCLAGFRPTVGVPPLVGRRPAVWRLCLVHAAIAPVRQCCASRMSAGMQWFVWHILSSVKYNKPAQGSQRHVTTSLLHAPGHGPTQRAPPFWEAPAVCMILTVSSIADCQERFQRKVPEKSQDYQNNRVANFLIASSLLR